MPNKLGWTIKLCQSKINPHIQRDTIDYEIHYKNVYIFLGQSPSTTIGDHHSFCQSVNHSIPQGYNRFFVHISTNNMAMHRIFFRLPYILCKLFFNQMSSLYIKELFLLYRLFPVCPSACRVRLIICLFPYSPVTSLP